MRELSLFIKKLIDFFGSLTGTILLSPIFIIIALSVKLTSKGPIFYKQDRLGKNGKIFKILKFRTMVQNAEKLGDGLFVKSDKDKRITKLGRILRSTSLDELPQLLNVVSGEMSLVGPRPPAPYHPYSIFDYSDVQKKRFIMKPGITGLAQVTVRNSATWDDRIVIDVNYVEAFDLILDIKILFKTLFKIVIQENIYPHFYKKGKELF